jgi:LacI family transcriptional regulator
MTSQYCFTQLLQKPGAMKKRETIAKSEDTTRRQRPSLRTVAEYINLSPTAVALALRGDESIPEETRRRVAAAAQELNYEYVPRARRSAAQRLRRLSFVMPDFGDRPLTANPFYGHLLVAAEQACQTHHASLSSVVLQRDHPENAVLPPALTHDLDGILLASPYPESLIDRVHKESGCPMVLVDHTLPGTPYDCVMNDDFYGAYQATNHLIELGHRQIVTLTGQSRNPDFPPSYKERYRGYCEACMAANLDVLPPAIIPFHIDERSVLNPTSSTHAEYEEWLRTVLKRAPQATAFFCVGDYFALGLIATMQVWGWRIPENFSVVGFDDFDMSREFNPPLTTIHPDKQAMAQIAVKRLLARIDGDETPPHYIAIQTRLILRASTDKMSASTGLIPEKGD